MLSQILFQEKGVALLPRTQGRSIPVFLTEEPDKIKAFLKQNAHIEDLVHQ